MPSFTEIATAVGAVVGAVGISVAATVYFAGGNGIGKSGSGSNPAANGSHRYVISDAYYLCRDHLDTAVSQPVRNIQVDSHSSRYDSNRNDNLIFIDLELMEGHGEGFGMARDAQVVCRVSAADNQIKSFQINKG